MNDTGFLKLRRTAFPRRAAYLIVCACLLLLFYVHFHQNGRLVEPSIVELSSGGTTKTTSSSDSTTDGPLPCRSLPGADDVMVVIKTGSTEIADKLPVHLNTTFRCYPQYAIFSDYEEYFMGQHVHDALKHASAKAQQEHTDFELWRTLQRGGRAALAPQELSGPISKPQNDNTGKRSNPGWVLDKWKFLPMVNRTLLEFPEKKWYVFVETDTYILWQTLLNYLNALDATKPYYIGGQIWIGTTLFAHGGTGFAISHPAMKNVVSMFRERQEEWESFTANHWAGDAVLGKALKESGTELTKAWPIWQGDDVGQITFWGVEDEDKQWCSPTVSYHHLSPWTVESLWKFEQNWIRQTKGDTKKFLRHRDMFAQYLIPRIYKNKVDWDNHADEDQGPVASLEACRKICAGNEGCLQYKLTPDTRCLTGTKPMLGSWSKGEESGWMSERIKRWGKKMEKCGQGDGWIT